MRLLYALLAIGCFLYIFSMLVDTERRTGTGRYGDDAPRGGASRSITIGLAVLAAGVTAILLVFGYRFILP